MSPEAALTKPEIAPIKVEKKKPTGTKELATMAKALNNIHDGMNEFMERILRSDEKNSVIAHNLSELIMAIRENPDHIDPEIREILKDLDYRVFEEKFYTEKCNKGVIRMTDDTKLSHLRAFAAEAAKVSAAKYKMSASDYVPRALVVEKLQQGIGVFQKLMDEHLGPVAGGQVAKQAVEKIAEIFDV